MKAFTISVEGRIQERFPKNGKDFSLEEMQGFVGGCIEIVQSKDGRLIILNDEGKQNDLPINIKATKLYGRFDDVVVGNVLVCAPKMIK